MNQQFIPSQLLKFCKGSEIEENGYSTEEFETLLNETYENILNGQFEFSFHKYKNIYLVKDLDQKLVLRKLNDNISRIYKDIQANRRLIISPQPGQK